MNGPPKNLEKMDGCTLALFAYGIFAVGYMIYWFASGGNPEVKKFREDCYRREASYYLPGDVPELARQGIVIKCERELRRWRGLPD